MEKNYFSQEQLALEPKAKAINFILNYSKSISVLRLNSKKVLIDLN